MVATRSCHQADIDPRIQSEQDEGSSGLNTQFLALTLCYEVPYPEISYKSLDSLRVPFKHTQPLWLLPKCCDIKLTNAYSIQQLLLDATDSPDTDGQPGLSLNYARK